MEFVFVVPRTTLFPERAPHGLCLFGTGAGEEVARGEGKGQAEGGGTPGSKNPDTKNPDTWDPDTWDRGAFDLCVREHGFFVERSYAEHTPTMKQVIPYTLVMRGSDILLLQRTKGGGDARLHDKLTIGVGGHVNPIDAVGSGEGETRVSDPLPAATRREVMEEELHVTGETHLVPVGLINDDTNAVGAVHVGFVQVLYLLGGDATIRETDQLKGEFVPVAELVQRLDAGANFETWSGLIVPHIDRILRLHGDAPRSQNHRPTLEGQQPAYAGNGL